MFDSSHVEAVAGFVSSVVLLLITSAKPFEAMQIATQISVIAENSIDHWEIISWTFNGERWFITLDNVFQLIALPVAVVTGYKIVIKPAISWVKDKFKRG